MQDWTLEPDEVMALPLDELALRVLADAHANQEDNWRTWLLKAKRGAYQQRADVIQVLAEAWGWLQAGGLITWTFDQDARAFTISRRGHQVLTEGLPWLRATRRLDVDLVPELEYTARPQFMRGDYETAAFVAMKEVEVQVRARAGFGTDLIGVALMRQAFRPGQGPSAGGPLSQQDQHGGEATATMELFAGAIGLFKNPASHRQVDFDDPTMAVEVILLADLLLRLLQRLPVTTDEA